MRSPLIVSLTGIRLAELDRFGPLAVGVILDPEARTSLQPADIAPRSGLSPTESRIASLTCDGKVAKDIARELDIGVATVRAHLKSSEIALRRADVHALVIAPVRSSGL